MSFYRAEHKHTQMHIHSQRHGHTHSGVYAILSWDRQTPPVHHSPRSFQRSVIIPGQKHLGRMTNLHSARCPGWLRLPCRFCFRRDSVIAEASYDWNGDKSHKGETDKDRKSATVKGKNTNSVYSQLIKTSSDSKSWLQPCVCVCLSVCLSVSVVSCLPSRALTVKALRLTQGTAHLSLAQKPSPCLGH